MRAVFKLYATQLKVRLGVSVLKYNLINKKTNLLKTLGLMLLMLFAGVELIGGYSFICYKLFGVTKLINHPEIIISFAYVASQVITLIFGLFFILGIIFFAKDSEFLSSLPLPQWQVFSSKFLLVYTNEIILTLVITAGYYIWYRHRCRSTFLLKGFFNFAFFAVYTTGYSFPAVNASYGCSK